MRKRKWSGFKALALAAAMTVSLAGCGSTAQEATVLVEETTAAEVTTTEVTTEATTEATEAATEVAEEGSGLKDGQVIFDRTFDDNKTTKFGTYKNGGSIEIVAQDMQMIAQIGSCGKLDYANQVYYDGFALNQGAIYTFSFDSYCDVERSMECRFQINGGDYHAYASDMIQLGTEMQHYEFDFEMSEASDPAPRLCFNMGLMQDMAEDPGKHNIYFDNVKLVVKNASAAMKVEALPESPNVTASQIGYNPSVAKTVISKVEGDESFDVIDSATGKSVFTGSFGDFAYAEGLAARAKTGDFSEVTTPGTYFIRTNTGEETYPFEIGTGIFNDIKKETVLMFYRQRCGCPVDAAIAGSGFEHPECHVSDAVVYGSDETKEVNGGWHDAGDYGRYVVAGATAIKQLFMCYTDNNYDADDLGIPESGNGVPDILDEAKYELDWMLKMQDPATGGVYHKVTCLAFPDTIGPEKEVDTLYLSPISTTATGDFAAVMAEASILYKDIDPEFAKTAFDAAVKAWDYVKDLDDHMGFVNPDDITTGEYPDHATMDEQFFAAAELKIAGYNDPSIDDRINKGLGLVEKVNPVTIALGWASLGAYPTYDIYRADDAVLGENAATWKKAAKDLILKKADEHLEIAKTDKYAMSNEKNYDWGSNSTIASVGMLYDMAYTITKNEEYKVYAAKQLDYILGANPLGYCFVTGFGSFAPKNPHHRPSQVAGKCPPGMLAGGANKNVNDPYAAAVLDPLKPAMCYVDNVQSYATNEIAIYWNSPLVYLLSTME